MTLVTTLTAFNIQGSCYAACCFCQVQFKLKPEIGTATNSSASAKDISQNTTTKDISKSIKNIVDVPEILYPRPTEPFMTVTIVSLFFVSVTQYFIGFGSLAKQLFRLFVSRITVGMMFECKLSIGIANFIACCIATDFQHIVIITF